MKWLTVLVCMTLLVSCDADRDSLAWTVTFACEEHRARASHVVLRILREDCRPERALAYEAELARSEEAPLPSSLSAGSYGFSAVAYEGSTLLASSCTKVTLPADAPIQLMLRGGEPCGSTDLDGGLGTGQGEGDALSDAAGEPLDASADASDGSTATQDAEAARSDAGSAQPDAGRDGGTPDAGAATSLVALSLTFSGKDETWCALPNAAVRDGSLLTLRYDLLASAGRRVQTSPAPSLLLREDQFREDTELDAFALLPDGRLLFSTSGSTRFGDEPVADDELIAYSPSTQRIERWFYLGSIGASVSGSDLDIDAAHVTADGTLYLSTDDDMKVHQTGQVVRATDLLRVKDGVVTRVVDGSARWGGRDLESVAVAPSGHFLISLSGNGAFGSGPVIDRDDIVELAFGPSDAFSAGYSLFMDGNVELAEPNGTLSALHISLP